MPGNTLVQIIPVTVAAGGSTVVVHRLSVNGTAVKPDTINVGRNGAGLDVDPVNVTTTTIQVDNPTAAPITSQLLVIAWHSILRQSDGGFNAFTGLSPQPFFMPSGGAGGGGGATEAFFYTATGAEGSDFTVTLPTAQPADTYAVLATCDGVSAIFGIDCPDLIAGDRTTTTFRCITSTALVLGDKISFLVSET